MEHLEQHHGIQSARYSQQDGLPALQQTAAADGSFHAPNQVVHARKLSNADGGRKNEETAAESKKKPAASAPSSFRILTSAFIDRDFSDLNLRGTETPRFLTMPIEDGTGAPLSAALAFCVLKEEVAVGKRQFVNDKCICK